MIVVLGVWLHLNSTENTEGSRILYLFSAYNHTTTGGEGWEEEGEGVPCVALFGIYCSEKGAYGPFPSIITSSLVPGTHLVLCTSSSGCFFFSSMVYVFIPF